MTSFYIAEMTSEECRNVAGEDTVVVIPMGSTELGGDYLPLGVDTIVADGIARAVTFADSVQTVYQDIREVTASGVMGNPAAASQEKGEAIVSRLADYTCSFLVEFRKLPIDLETPEAT